MCEDIFDLRIYVTVTSPYPRDRGVTEWESGVLPWSEGNCSHDSAKGGWDSAGQGNSRRGHGALLAAAVCGGMVMKMPWRGGNSHGAVSYTHLTLPTIYSV